MKKILFSLFLIVFLLQFLLPVVNAQGQNYVDFIITPTTPKYGITNILVKKKCFESDCYDTVEVNDYGFILKPGEPLLPMKNVILAIPYNAEISSIKEISRKEEILTGTYDIQPCPPIDYLGSTRAQSKPQKNMTIYGKNEFYPSVNYEIQGPYFYRGQKIILIKFYPIQYNPVTKTLKKIKNIHVRIYYSEKGLRTNVKRERDTLLENFIYNYNQALSNGWGKRKIEMTAPLRSPTFEEGTALPPGSSYDYVLITDDSLANAAQPLVNWRNQHGIAARLITTSYIYSHYGGSNNAERIRNFIIDAYNNWGIKYVVLGGDAEIIPAVNVWPPSVYIITYNTYSDYYYAGLDGNWDTNGNGVLGEIYVEFPFLPLPIPVIVDEADWFPEVYVGRLPVSNSNEMSTVVNKIINYEANFEKREDNMLMLAAKANDNDDCADTKEFIIATAINSPRMPSPYSVTKLYESLGNLSIENTINELNKGYKFVNYADHGTETELNLAIDTSHIQNLTNINNLPFFYAMACLSGCFLLDRIQIFTGVHEYDLNYDCLGEKLITANNGGVVGYIGATVPVPYVPGNMHAMSNALDEEFWFEFFPGYFYIPFFNITTYGGGYFNPGDALYVAKVKYVQNSDMSDQRNRLVVLAFNLLGDPIINVCFSGSSECYEKTPNIKWCDGNTKKVCDSNCQYSYQNCRTDAYDTDGGLNYLVRGTCYDYDGCNPSTGDCKVTTFADYCSSDYVIEYFVSGSFCSATSYNCKNYGSYYTCSGGVCTSGGGGGCPILKVWNGENFLELGKLDIHSKKGIDKILEKEVEMEPFEKGKYKIILKEASYLSLIGSGSEIDSIRLLDEEGKECKLVSAIHSKEGEVLSLLRNSDDKKIQLKPDQELFLTFEDCSGRKFRFIIEGENWRPPFLKVRGPAEFFAAIGKNITESIRKMLSSISDFFK